MVKMCEKINNVLRELLKDEVIEVEDINGNKVKIPIFHSAYTYGNGIAIMFTRVNCGVELSVERENNEYRVDCCSDYYGLNNKILAYFKDLKKQGVLQKYLADKAIVII
jgi:hypothetical protein